MLTKLLGRRRLKYDNYHGCRRMLKLKKIILQLLKIILNYSYLSS
ncbi:hypothetical protein SAMN05443663_102145 [Flavobacterium defluvii]|uniref:Uncharacterized protein n=1 Tax=Flavobacterium defluvii TaxID=370979 RepID=A0A1M5HU99_9FLAO|nr:hypothetical protein SAMN05443663_102145 [Flavobacterium defluvii]